MMMVMMMMYLTSPPRSSQVPQTLCLRFRIHSSRRSCRHRRRLRLRLYSNRSLARFALDTPHWRGRGILFDISLCAMPVSSLECAVRLFFTAWIKELVAGVVVFALFARANAFIALRPSLLRVRPKQLT